MRNSTDEIDEVPLIIGISVGCALCFILLVLAIDYSYRVAFRRRT
jgi:hypothetical protein